MSEKRDIRSRGNRISSFLSRQDGLVVVGFGLPIGFGRVRFAMHFLQAFDAHVRIDLSCIQPGMPQELLKTSYVGPRFHHQCGCSVTQ